MHGSSVLPGRLSDLAINSPQGQPGIEQPFAKPQGGTENNRWLTLSMISSELYINTIIYTQGQRYIMSTSYWS